MSTSKVCRLSSSRYHICGYLVFCTNTSAMLIFKPLDVASFVRVYLWWQGRKRKTQKIWRSCIVCYFYANGNTLESVGFWKSWCTNRWRFHEDFSGKVSDQYLYYHSSPFIWTSMVFRNNAETTKNLLTSRLRSLKIRMQVYTELRKGKKHRSIFCLFTAQLITSDDSFNISKR